MRNFFQYSTPTSLLHFDADTLMYVQADGNYVTLHFRGKFSKVGRSLIVNIKYVFSINTTRQELVISDKMMFTHTLSPSKKALDEFKTQFEKL